MQKYRDNTQQRINETKLEFLKVKESCLNCKCGDKIYAQAEQIDQLVKMMAEMMSDGSNEFNKMLEENIKLKTENASLRQILSASKAIKDMKTCDVACGWSFHEEEESNDELDVSRETVCENPEFNDAD
jgi:regulator of replication initiation timing